MTPKEERILEILRSIGFFEMKNGSITFHFDYQGKLKQVKMEQVTYSDKVINS